MTETDLRIKMAEAKGWHRIGEFPNREFPGWTPPGDIGWTYQCKCGNGSWTRYFADTPEALPPLDHWCWGCVVELAENDYVLHPSLNWEIQHDLGSGEYTTFVEHKDPAVAVCTAWLKMKGLA